MSEKDEIMERIIKQVELVLRLSHEVDLDPSQNLPLTIPYQHWLLYGEELKVLRPDLFDKVTLLGKKS